MRHTVIVIGLMALGSALGCDMIKVQGVVKTTVMQDGQTTTKEHHFDKLEDMPKAFDAAADDLGETTDKLIKELTEAPPPGKVKLGDLSPALKEHENSPAIDFLARQTKETGKDTEFSYVRIGVKSYDDFFQKTAEMHALAFQAKQMVHRLKTLSVKVLGKADVDLAKGALKAAVEAALKTEPTSENQGDLDELQELEKMTTAIASTVVAFAQKTQELVAAGQQLVTGAPASITNPKTALHLDLIVKGLKQSVELVGKSGELLAEVAGEIV